MVEVYNVRCWDRKEDDTDLDELLNECWNIMEVDEVEKGYLKFFNREYMWYNNSFTTVNRNLCYWDNSGCFRLEFFKADKVIIKFKEDTYVKQIDHGGFEPEEVDKVYNKGDTLILYWLDNIWFGERGKLSVDSVDITVYNLPHINNYYLEKKNISADEKEEIRRKYFIKTNSNRRFYNNRNWGKIVVDYNVNKCISEFI